MAQIAKNVIRKSSGEVEPFSSHKLFRSVSRTGLDKKCCVEIANEVSKKIKKNASSKEIFKHTVKLIRRRSTVAAIRYSLKKSLLQLGPTGFEFEKYVAKYFESLGYQTKVGQKIKGKFVSHEIDVIVYDQFEKHFVECKFHNNPAKKNDIKTTLYVKSRWDDVKDRVEQHNLKSFYIVSNTSFSKDAITYGNGVGLKLLGVNAPEKESFLDLIKTKKLYPITSLLRLKKKYLKPLLSKNIVLCSELYNKKNTMISVGMPEEEIEQVLSDIESLLYQS